MTDSIIDFPSKLNDPRTLLCIEQLSSLEIGWNIRADTAHDYHCAVLAARKLDAAPELSPRFLGHWYADASFGRVWRIA